MWLSRAKSQRACVREVLLVSPPPLVRRDDKQDNVVFGRVPWELLLGKDTGASASTVDAYEDKIGEDVVIYAQLFRGRDFLNKFLGDLFIPMPN